MAKNAHFHHRSGNLSTLPYSALQPTTLPYFCPLLSTLHHIIGCFPRMSRENILFLKNSCEDQKSLDGSFLTPYLVVFQKFASYI